MAAVVGAEGRTPRKKAKMWCDKIDAVFERKWPGGSMTFSKDRARYWRLVVQCFEKAASCSTCPATALLGALHIAEHRADIAMLPPNPARAMFSSLNAGGGYGLSMHGDQQYAGQDVDDGQIPRILEQLIQRLDEGSTSDPDTRAALLHGAAKLMSCKNVNNWVERSGELKHWCKSFRALGEEILDKLGSSEADRAETRAAADGMRQEDEARSQQKLAEMMTNGGLEEMLRQSAPPDDWGSPDEMQRILSRDAGQIEEDAAAIPSFGSAGV